MDVIRTRAHNRRDSFRECPSGFKRSIGAGFDDGACDGTRVPLFPEDENDIGKVTLAGLVDDIGCAWPLAAHAHVEGAIKAE